MVVVRHAAGPATGRGEWPLPSSHTTRLCALQEMAAAQRDGCERAAEYR